MKQIIVNVGGITIEEKQRVNEALAKIKNIIMCNPPRWDEVITMYGPSLDGFSVGFDYHNGAKPTHTPQRVLEMAGMETIADQHVFLADKFIITDSSGRIVYDGTLRSISSFIKSRVSAGKGGSLPSSGFSVKTDENGVAVMVPKQGHIHSDLMAVFAEDAKTTAYPWELWQFKDCDGNWVSCAASPVWVTRTEYRRKPKKTHC